MNHITEDLIEFEDDPALSARVRNSIIDNEGNKLCNEANRARDPDYRYKAHRRTNGLNSPALDKHMTMKNFMEYVGSPIV